MQAIPPQFFSRLPPGFPDPHDLQSNTLQLMPPLKRKTMELNFLNVQNNIPQPPAIQTVPQQRLPQQEVAISPEKADHKERNRLAAQKWRQKQDGYLGELEDANDELRAQVYQMQHQVLALKVENKVLEGELQFFQQFMAKIMSATPRPQM